MKIRLYSSIGLVIIFILGATYIIQNNRPLVKNNEVYTSVSNNNSENAIELEYDMSEIESRSTKGNCWAAIDENVYDLTSWINQHPGGREKIIELCGTDATGAFEAMHGDSSKAKQALILLKIGTLNPSSNDK